jgi:hypothetical protein
MKDPLFPRPGWTRRGSLRAGCGFDGAYELSPDLVLAEQAPDKLFGWTKLE